MLYANRIMASLSREIKRNERPKRIGYIRVIR